MLKDRITLGKLWRQPTGYGEEWTTLSNLLKGFSEYGTYYHEYLCWKQAISFKHRGYYDFRIPLYKCIFLIVKTKYLK